MYININTVGRQRGGGRGGSDGFATGGPDPPFPRGWSYFLESLSGNWGWLQNRVYSWVGHGNIQSVVQSGLYHDSICSPRPSEPRRRDTGKVRTEDNRETRNSRVSMATEREVGIRNINKYKRLQTPPHIKVGSPVSFLPAHLPRP